jgi:hypothetical protein
LILKKIGPAAETQQSMEAVMIPLDSSRVEKVFLSETFEEKYCVIVFIRKDHSLTLRIICIEEGKGSMIVIFKVHKGI